MKGRWFQFYLNRIKDSYSDLIIVADYDDLGQIPDIKAALEEDFAIYYYKSELGIRAFFAQKGDAKRALIFRSPEISYIPYDIEEKADILIWQLKDVFPNLYINALKQCQPENYQKIYEKYNEIMDMLPEAGEKETEKLLADWLKQYEIKIITEHQDKSRESKERYVSGCNELKKDIEHFLLRDKVDWRKLGLLWGQFSYLHDLLGDDITPALITEMFTRFEDYIYQDYDKLFFEGFFNGPATIDKVLPYLASLDAQKNAVICFDGMGCQEWFILKDYLVNAGITELNENALFALLPTVTQVSRKALFSGHRVLDKLLKEDAGFAKYFFDNKPGSSQKSSKLFFNAGVKWHPKYTEYDYLALIINLVDDCAHSTVLINGSKRLLQHNLATLLVESEIASIIKNLLEAGYRVFLTSDHGSIWSEGNGMRPEKYLVEDRAKRALLYPNKALAQEFVKDKNLWIYENTGILGKKVIVLPREREMFANEGSLEITHGGISIEEVIIPFVEVLS